MPRCDICEQPAYKTCHVCELLHTFYINDTVLLCKEHWGDNPNMCKDCAYEISEEELKDLLLS